MMSRQLTIHIGAHKCGSSSFQELLTAQADALADQGVRYLSAGREDSTNHHRLVRTVEAQTGRKSQRIPPQGLKRIQTRFWEEVRSSNEANLLVSSEAFEHLTMDCDLSFFRRLRREGISIRTLFFVREHVSLFNSTYVEVVRSLQCLTPIEEYFQTRERYFATRFSRVLRRWERFSDEVVVREFSPGAMEDFVRDEWDVKAELPHSRAGLTPTQIQAALYYARHFAEVESTHAPALWDHLQFHEALGVAADRDQPIEGGYWGVNDDLLAAITHCVEDDREILRSSYGLKLPEPVQRPLNTVGSPLAASERRAIEALLQGFLPPEVIREHLSS